LESSHEGNCQEKKKTGEGAKTDGTSGQGESGAKTQGRFRSVAAERPPKRQIRSTKCLEVFYGFGDASATGHATNFQRVINKKGTSFELDNKIYFRYGHWCDAVSEASSKYRDLLNLVESLAAEVADGRLKGAEVFLFTDNSTAEAVFYKGNSTSRHLFELVLRLQKLEMAGDLILHVVHVAGTQMVAEGADGGSRGDLNQGVMAGQLILDFVPLHLTALERSDKVEKWVWSRWDDERGELKTLTPEGWFKEGQQEGNFLWAPPPAASGGGGCGWGALGGSETQEAVLHSPCCCSETHDRKMEKDLGKRIGLFD
jgi:hypothetical protein